MYMYEKYECDVRLEANEQISHANWEFYSQYAVTHLHNFRYFEYRTHLRVNSIRFERRKKRSSLIAALYFIIFVVYQSVL